MIPHRECRGWFTWRWAFIAADKGSRLDGRRRRVFKGSDMWHIEVVS